MGDSGNRRQLPYGCWPSPLSAAAVSALQSQPRELRLTDRALYWLQSRPDQGGRTEIMLLLPEAGGEAVSALPEPWDCRSRVHEYGGGALAVDGEELYFCHAGDNQIYHYRPGSGDAPRCLSTGDPALRYGALCVDRHRRRLLAVCEDHRAAGEPRNYLVAIAANENEAPKILAEGDDFYASPTLSPDGSNLSWISWSHPRMPWDRTTLWLAALDREGLPKAPRAVAADAAVCQPAFGPGGELFFISDRSGWWNLYRYDGRQTWPVMPSDTEFAQPPWTFGQSSYACLGARELLASHCRDGRWELLRIDCNARTGTMQISTGTGTPLRGIGTGTPLDLPFTQIGQLRAAAGRAAFIAASASTAPEVVLMLEDGELQRPTNGRSEALNGTVSEPVPVRFKGEDGADIHSLYYAPANDLFTAPDDHLPPLLVVAHGGPTGAAEPAWNPQLQFWTSRGFAVLAVNYRGSVNYGRAYRERLAGQWGVLDAADCAAGALHLVAEGLVHPGQVAIRGNSAGGLTVLSALCRYPLFAAGASYYGISDLERLARETHKFESRYLDSLIGPWPECQKRYRDRSAIHRVAEIQAPVILFQGLQDHVVPPEQTRAMVRSLRRSGIEAREVLFENEGHGFRRSENISAALEAELAFYHDIFGLQEAGG